MIKIRLTKVIASDAVSIMKLLLAHDQLEQFFSGKFVQTKSAGHGEPQGGYGAIRKVTLHGQTFFEQIVFANQEHIRYRIIGEGPVSNHQGDIMLLSQGDDTLIEYSIVCQAPWWQPQFIVKAIISHDIRQGLNKLARYCNEC